MSPFGRIYPLQTRIRPGQCVTGWLPFSVLAGTQVECGNANRTRRRQAGLIDRAGRHDSGPAAHNDVERWIEAEATMREIRRLLNVLSRGQRDVVELVARADLPLTAAAEILGIPAGTAKSRLSRARARLLQAGAAALLHSCEGAV